MVTRTLWRSSLRYTLEHRWYSGLGFLGIALGVAIVVAVDLANESARKAFELSLTRITGGITHQILPNSGTLDEQVFVRLRTQLGISNSAPLVQADIEINGETLTLLGIDPISEWGLQRHAGIFGNNSLPRLQQQANGVIVSIGSAERLGLTPGADIHARYGSQALPLVLLDTFGKRGDESLEGVIFTDIANAQHLLGRRGSLDRIDLDLTEKETQQIEAWLPAAYRLVDAQARNHGLLSISEAFHTNLTAMSLLALLVGALLIYNSTHFSVMQRTPITGTFRALGVTRRELVTLVLGESLSLALLASLFGVVVGYLLSQHLVQLVTRTVDDLYYTLTVSSFQLSTESLLKGVGLGLGTTLMSALLPAVSASRTPAITLQRRSEAEQRWRTRYNRLAVLGVLLFSSGYLYSQLPGESLLGGFLSLAIMVIGYCCLVPAALQGACRLLQRFALPRLGAARSLAISGVITGISRTGLAVAALAVALATTIGITIMIGSFRHSVAQWLAVSLRGDIFLSAPESGAPGTPGIPETLVDALRHLDTVTEVTALRRLSVESERGPLTVISATPFRPDNRAPLLGGVENANERFAEAQGIFISEPLAYHRRLNPGDKLTLYTLTGSRAFPVLGIFRNYSSSRGIISMPAATLSRYWEPVPIRGLFIDGVNATSQAGLRASVQHLLNALPETYRLTSNREFREYSLSIFDRTFAITHVLRLLVLIVAVTGLLSALLTLQLEKFREYAVLRAIGMSQRQMTGLIFQQSALLGFLAALLSLPLGAVMAERLIQVINRRSFGWTMDVVFPPGILLETLLLAVGAALLAALYPAWKQRQRAIAPQLREE